MATTLDVLQMLRPNGGWSNSGEGYEGINFQNVEPFTEAEFTAGFAQYDSWKIEQDAQAEAARLSAESKLEALGLTTEDLKALGL
jgi:hypothetical protein